MRWLVFILILAFGTPQAFAWNCLNAHRNTVTLIAGASGHSDEIRIDLAASDFPTDYVFTPGGADLRVVLARDDTTPVDHIVTGWDALTQTGAIYIKMPAPAPSSSTSVHLYYWDASLASLGDVDAVPTRVLR
ncbi:MAG: DUF2341 domain-containing protein [Pseudomonadota bacterium]